MIRQFFAPVGSGLGDVIVSLPILHALINRKLPTYLVANSERQLGLEPCVPGLSGTMPRPDLNSILKADDLFYDFRAHPLQTDHVWGSAAFEKQFPGLRINEILTLICNDLGIDADFSRFPPIPCAPRIDLAEHIVLIPGTVTNAKSWPLTYWFQLCHRLTKLSQKLLLVGEPHRSPIVKQLIDGGIPWIETTQLTDAIDIISAVKQVISVDTGLMHIAVNQGVQTIALFEHTPIYYRPHANCHPLFAGQCVLECLQEIEGFAARRSTSEQWCWYHGDFLRCKAPEPQRCMSAISVDAVLSNASVAHL